MAQENTGQDILSFPSLVSTILASIQLTGHINIYPRRYHMATFHTFTMQREKYQLTEKRLKISFLFVKINKLPPNILFIYIPSSDAKILLVTKFKPREFPQSE